MILLDTDHLSILQHAEDPLRASLVNAMERSADTDFFASAVSLKEQMRGWLAAINRTRRTHDQTIYYTRLTGLFEFFADWEILPFDALAADKFDSLRKSGVRIGTMDLKIASIALTNNAMLITANLVDFEQVPGLQVEDWLH